MRYAAALFAYILFTVNAWGAIEYKGTTATDIDALYKQAESESGATSRQEEGYIRITVPSKYTTYYFTTESHPCHPAVVIQRMYEENGALYIKAEGLTAGDRTKFEQWLKGFERQHEKIKQNLGAGKHGS